MILCDHLWQYKLEGCRLFQTTPLYNLQCPPMKRDNFPCKMQANPDSTALFHLVKTVKNQLSFLFFNPFSLISDIQLVIICIFFQKNLYLASVFAYSMAFSVHFLASFSQNPSQESRHSFGTSFSNPTLFSSAKGCVLSMHSSMSPVRFSFFRFIQIFPESICASLRSTIVISDIHCTFFTQSSSF